MALAWFGYVGFFVVLLILGELGLLPAGLISKAALMLLAVPIFAAFALSAHLTGRAIARGGGYDRKKQPLGFWFLTSFYWLCTIALLLGGSAAALGYLK